MDVRGVASEQDPPAAVRGGLSGGVGEAGDPRGTVHTEIGPVHPDEGTAQVGKRGFSRRPELSFRRHDPIGAPIRHPMQPVRSRLVLPHPGRRLVGDLDLGDEVAARRVRPGERDAGRPAQNASSAVRSDEVPGSRRPTVAEFDVDTALVLDEAGHVAASLHPHPELLDPVAEDRLDPVLPQSQAVRMPRREVADVQRRRAKPGGLRDLPFGEEPIGDPA